MQIANHGFSLQKTIACQSNNDIPSAIGCRTNRRLCEIVSADFRVWIVLVPKFDLVAPKIKLSTTVVEIDHTDLVALAERFRDCRKRTGIHAAKSVDNTIMIEHQCGSYRISGHVQFSDVDAVRGFETIGCHVSVAETILNCKESERENYLLE